MQVFLATCGGWYLPRAAKAFESRDSLAEFWISDKNSTGVSVAKYRRCWPFHLAMKPFYHLAPQIVVERMFYRFFPLWRRWFEARKLPECDVVQAIAGYATEPFQRADAAGALKVIDCPNSHPDSLRDIWQTECDRWCPGEKVPIPQWMFARMRREIEEADLVLCPSIFVRETMVDRGIPEDKCLVNPFGVDTSIFTPRERIPSRPRFVAVGTICLRKGHQYLFRAFEEVKKKRPDAELIVVGDYKIDFKRERSRWEGSFTHHRFLAHGDLAKLLNECTAFVLPSLEEGFARVIIEAMAAGLPVIATHESGATTLVQDGAEGIIVPSRNAEQLSASMLKIAEDTDLNRSMGLAALARGGERNTWQDYGDRLLAEYDRRLGTREGR
jgi:glycosyltransferase involved in cell wall biosynthesis